MQGKEDLLNHLDATGIPFECEDHAPILNMAESGTLVLKLVGARCKNLLLQEKGGQYFLVVTTSAKSLDLTGVAATLGSKRLSFASADRLFELLGVRTGSLSPLALINDEAKHVRLIVDADLSAEHHFLFHPLQNSASVLLSRHAFDAFLAGIGHAAHWLPLAARTA